MLQMLEFEGLPEKWGRRWGGKMRIFMQDSRLKFEFITFRDRRTRGFGLPVGG